MTEKIQTTTGTGKILKDAIKRSENFDWEAHSRWLFSKTMQVRKLAQKYPINHIWKIDENSPILPNVIVYIDGYSSNQVGVTPLGSTFTTKLDPNYLRDITVDVKLGKITEEDVMKSLSLVSK